MEVTTTLEEDHITTVVLRMGMGTELTTIRTAPTRPLPPKETYVRLHVLSAGRQGTMPMIAPKEGMETEMEALGRSPIHSTKDN